MVEGRKHYFTLTDRERLTVGGVSHVISFDDRRVVLETVMGPLVIEGEGFNIHNLNLESGELAVTGTIISLAYSNKYGGKGRGESLLKKILR